MKNLVICIVSIFMFSTSLNTVLAEEQSNEEDNHTIYDMFSAEQINEWERELEYHAYNDPIVGDWKVTGTKSVVQQASENSRNGNYTVTGSWTWRDGVICITSTCTTGQWDHGHAGIVAVAPYYDSTCEANPGTGVSTVVGEWYNRFDGYNVWQVGVNSTTVAQDAAAAEWACSQIGKGYQFWGNTLSNRNKFYCSHLVYAAYLDVCGVNLDTSAYTTSVIHPYEFFSNSLTSIIYRKYYPIS